MTRKNSVVTLLVYFIFNYILKVYINFMNISSSKEIFFSLLFNSILIFILVYINYGYFKKSEKNFKKVYFLYAIVAFLFYIVVLNLSVYFFSLFNIEPFVTSNQNEINNLFKTTAIPVSIVVFFQAPIIQEIVYRAAILFLITDKHMNKKILTIVGCIVSTILFAMIHLFGNFGSSFTIVEFISMVFPYLLLSGTISFLFYKSKFNIFVPLLFHLINNIICFIFMYF